MNAFYQAIATQDAGYGSEGTIKEHFNRRISSIYGTNKSLPLQQFTVDYLTHPNVRGKGRTNLFGQFQALDYLNKMDQHARASNIGVSIRVINGDVFVA